MITIVLCNRNVCIERNVSRGGGNLYWHLVRQVKTGFKESALLFLKPFSERLIASL
uniref:Uncharacterized protein n=1 Tax=Physcomitrium patens TaxID=3218 RepID=A0A2K1JLF3_PHYPA|nr:hypothetical protein PHYPA_017202 [Physcomitrium patens]